MDTGLPANPPHRRRGPPLPATRIRKPSALEVRKDGSQDTAAGKTDISRLHQTARHSKAALKNGASAKHKKARSAGTAGRHQHTLRTSPDERSGLLHSSSGGSSFAKLSSVITEEEEEEEMEEGGNEGRLMTNSEPPNNEEEGEMTVQMLDKQQALFQSYMAQQGLHPAYLYGLRRPPPGFLQQAGLPSATSPMQQPFSAYGLGGASQASGSNTPGESFSSNPHMGAAEYLMPGGAIQYPQAYPFGFYGGPTGHMMPEASHMPFQGTDLAINPHGQIPRVGPTNRWPYIPEYTVPGFVFEGAEFHKDYAFKEPTPADSTDGKSTAKANGVTSLSKLPRIRSAVRSFVNSFSTCLAW